MALNLHSICWVAYCLSSPNSRWLARLLAQSRKVSTFNSFPHNLQQTTSIAETLRIKSAQRRESTSEPSRKFTVTKATRERAEYFYPSTCLRDSPPLVGAKGMIFLASPVKASQTSVLFIALVCTIRPPGGAHEWRHSSSAGDARPG